MKVEQRINRWKNFYDDTTGETRILYIIDYEQGNGKNWPPLWSENKKLRSEWAWKNYLDGLERTKWLEDDYLPYLSVVSGTEIFAEAFGAKVFRPEKNMPCAIPFIFSPEDAEKVKTPRLEDTPLMDLFDIADELKCRGGKEALLKLPDIQSPMDIVAQIWDKSDLFPNMIDQPEVVKELSEKIKLLLFEFFDCWFQRYGRCYIGHHPDYYMEGGVTLSVDEIGNVSSVMFEDFFAQELDELSLRYGGIGIHCCAESRHQWKH